MKRARLNSEEKVGSYFLSQRTVEFLTTGCCTLDACLGGGWPLGKVVNVVGDRSTGKTLLAIEACANFARAYPDGSIYYLEAEAAFDKAYAAALGMPVDRIEFIEDVQTVEDAYAEILRVTEKSSKHPSIFILDSLDALSDAAELDRDINKGSMGAEKAKKLSQIFRKITKRLQSRRMLLIIISQVRDKLGVMFGKKQTRSGGKALDFYASQVVWLHEAGKIYKTKGAIKRPIGVGVRAMVEKNKVGLPYRTCNFEILFGFGVDSLSSGLEFLASIDRLDMVEDGLNKRRLKKFQSAVNRMDDREYYKTTRRVYKAVRKAWREVEEMFLPKRRKYG